jgi:hypothetical protein
MYRSVRSFIADARHNWLLAVPAGLYAINNYLKFAMQLYFRCGCGAELQYHAKGEGLQLCRSSLPYSLDRHRFVQA